MVVILELCAGRKVALWAKSETLHNIFAFTQIQCFVFVFVFLNQSFFLYFSFKLSPIPSFVFKNCDLFYTASSQGISLEVQWLGFSTFTARAQGSTPGWGTKTSHASWCSQIKKKERKKERKKVLQSKVKVHGISTL